MDNAQDHAWRVSWELTDDRARGCLNHSAALPPSVSRGRPFHGIPRLRLWDDAGGFACEREPATLSVFELSTDGDKRQTVVREAVWQRSADWKRVWESVGSSKRAVAFEPTMRVRDGTVPCEHLHDLLLEASVLRVPVVWFQDAGLVVSSVGRVGFEFFGRDQPPAALRLTWSDAIPPEWDGIVEWFQRVRRFLEGCLPASAEPA
jgi:hypothetical protein